MTKKIDQAIREQEASNLLAWMEKRGFSENRAAFASKAGRTRAELSQHLKTDRPIPLSAVKSYAAILQCEVKDISPRWHNELTILPGERSINVTPPSKRDVQIKAINDLLFHMSNEGLAVVLDKAEEMQRKYPIKHRK